jgi:hypothetical protein
LRWGLANFYPGWPSTSILSISALLAKIAGLSHPAWLFTSFGFGFDFGF